MKVLRYNHLYNGAETLPAAARECCLLLLPTDYEIHNYSNGVGVGKLLGDIPILESRFVFLAIPILLRVQLGYLAKSELINL